MTSPISEPVTPPKQVLGYEATQTPGWGYFSQGMLMDQYEDVPQLQWPLSVKTFHSMRTDAQCDALIKSVQLPLRRLNWKIKPNGARDEVVADISAQTNLPIQGDNDEFILRGRNRFNHDEHLRMALMAPCVYGHMPFEQVGEIMASDLAWRMSSLSPRMPQTIAGWDVARNGDLNAIIQYDPSGGIGWMDINTGGRRQNRRNSSTGPFQQGIPIPRSQLAMYVWEREGGNWAGRSMMRPLFKYWVLKDRMLRIDAMKNERFGLGIPTGTAPPGGDPADYSKLAQGIRAVENGGVGLPNGASMGWEGVKGTLPDTLASIKMYDEQMARSWLLMVIQLGQTQTGSRALGESFLDFFSDSLWAFAKWYAMTFTQDVIWDIVDWNWGEDEQAPVLVPEGTDDNMPLGATELAELVRAGALLVDDELQTWIRKRFDMPDYKPGNQPLPTRPGTPSQDTVGAPTQARERIRVTDKRHVAAHQPDNDKHDQGDHGNRKADEVVGDPKVDEPVQSPYGEDEPHTNDDGTVTFPNAGARITYVGAATQDAPRARAQTLNSPRVGHREPTAVEAASGADFSAIQKAWEDATKSLVEKWLTNVRPDQIDALVKTVEDAVANGDMAALAAPDAPVLGEDLIMEHMVDVAGQAITDAIAEAASQGVTLPPLDAVDLASSLQYRATAVANLLGRGLADSAGRNAILNYAPDVAPEDVGTAVRGALADLSDSFLNDQLGGALTGAQNTARMSVFDSGDGAAPTVYASELLDENTCDECEAIDGHEYGSMDEAAADYPAGGYSECAGGPRCRGTLVAVYGEGQN